VLRFDRRESNGEILLPYAGAYFDLNLSGETEDNSESVFKHPCGDIAVLVENAPYVDVVVAFKIENEVGITW
jgi:hypothetical protein